VTRFRDAHDHAVFTLVCAGDGDRVWYVCSVYWGLSKLWCHSYIAVQV